MNKAKIIIACMALAASSFVFASPEDDRKQMKNYYTNKFEKVKFQDFVNGVYALDAIAKENFDAIEEFPPYMLNIEDGEEMWKKPFKNGKTYNDCFPDGPAIAHKYPYWNNKQKQVVTLPVALNQCRKANGERKLRYKKGIINNILSYIAYESRGKTIKTIVPSDPGAQAAYEKGKQFFYAKRGQLNFSCADCHVSASGKYLRSEMISPSLGATSHFPVYRSAWGTVGTLHRRFYGCNKLIKAKPFKAQGDEYRNLEYFMSYMSNGIKLNGPGSRK